MARENKTSPVIGVLPLFQIKGMIKAHISNGLFGAYASVLADCAEARTALIEHAQKMIKKERIRYLLLKTLEDPFHSKPEGFYTMDSWVIATLQLNPDPSFMWDGLRDKIRNCVRKALKHGLEVRTEKKYLPHFYDVLADNMHRKGAPIYGYEFMKGILDGFGNRSEIITVWSGGEIVSGAMVLNHRETVYVPFASSRPWALHMSPNNLLYWEIIRQSCLRGMNTLDFGRSMKGTGSLAFKLGWGAQESPQPCLIYSKDGTEINFDPHQRGVGWLINQWKRLPRNFADRLGPLVCKQIAGLL